MCLRRAPEKYIAVAKAPADRAGLWGQSRCHISVPNILSVVLYGARLGC
jgi:hypothetical protein